MNNRSIVAKVASAVGCLLIASCGHRPPLSDERRVQTSEEVANVFVSSYPAVPWNEIADKLEPKHDLSAADARALAAVTTQSQVSQFLSTFAAGLALGLPSRTRSSTTSTTDGVTTSTSIKKLEPGAAPASSGASPVAISDASLAADLSKTPAALGIDASTQLTTGTAVFQLAKILDNQISKAIAPKGYQAHLLTFQVNLQPKGRNLPYDAYVNLTLMPASWKKALETSKGVAKDASELPAILLYPLVISDAMESSSSAKSIEVIRQAALSLSGVISNVGLNAGVSGGSDSLNALAGSDRNSLVTVGRVSDHTLRMRFGAQLQGSRSLALVPRTHNVSVVVFTRAGDTAETFIDRLAVITETSFLDSASGEEVPSARNTQEGRAKLRTQVVDSLREYGYRLAPECGYAPDLVRALDRGDYGYVSHCIANPNKVSASAKGRGVQSATGDDLKDAARLTEAAQANAGEEALVPAEEARLRRVVADLMTRQADSRFSKFTVQLTPFKDPRLVLPPNSQLAFLNDDRAAAKVVLRQGKNLATAKLQAKLVVTPDKTAYSVLPTAVEADAEGKTLTLTFPSLLASGLMASKPATGKAPAETDLDPALSLQVEALDAREAAHAGSPGTYSVKLLRPPQKPAGNPVSTGSTVLLADAAGTAKVTLQIAEWDAKRRGDLAVRVSGAEVRSTEPQKVADAKIGGIPVAGATSVVLNLGNVTPGRAVQITAIAKKESIGDAVVLPVIPAAAVSK